MRCVAGFEYPDVSKKRGAFTYASQTLKMKTLSIETSSGSFNQYQHPRHKLCDIY
jgi:hypothetical protein